MVPLLAVAAWLIILVLPAAGAAQAGPVRQPVIESLRDSQWVRLATSDLGRRHGRLLDPGASELVLATDGGGALVGTIFGAAIPRWKRRYP